LVCEASFVRDVFGDADRPRKVNGVELLTFKWYIGWGLGDEDVQIKFGCFETI
jgi:hypothetical protein